MFKTILVGLDGSENAERGLPVAADLAKRYGAKVVIAHVDERIAAKGGAPSVYADEDEVRAALGKHIEALSQDGVEAALETDVAVMGGPAHAIVEIADRVGADLIVVGTRGHAPVAGLLLGSVATRLLHLAKQPVLAIPPP